MPSSCKEIRQELIECMLKSNCVLVKRNTVAECFKAEHAADVPSECHSIRKSYAECRRGMVIQRGSFVSFDCCDRKLIISLFPRVRLILANDSEGTQPNSTQ